MKKVRWRWKGKTIEEVKEFNKYLGYTLQINGGQETHVKERTRRAADNGSNMGYREEMVWEGFRKKALAIR